MEHKKPTRIVAEPKMISAYHGSQLQIACDNGLTYSMVELATELGISTTTMYKRLKEIGWADERILKLPLQKHKKAEPFEFIDGCEEGDCAHLSGRDRSHNLNKIPELTPYERQLDMGVQ